MLVGESLPFIRDYISAMNELIKHTNPDNKLSRLHFGHTFNFTSFTIFGETFDLGFTAKQKREAAAVYYVNAYVNDADKASLVAHQDAE